MASGVMKVVVLGDTTSFERAMARAHAGTANFGKQVDGQVKSLNRWHSSIGTLAGSFIGAAGLIDVLKKSVDAASDLHEQINKTDVVFKSSAGSVKAWSKTSSTSMGIARHEALAMAATFGNLLVPMGFARDKAAQMSTRMVKLAGDMASFNNASPEDTLKALQSGLAGQVRPLRQFGVFLDQNRIKAEALSDGIVKATGSIRGVDEAQQRVAIAQAQYTAAMQKYGDGTTQVAQAHVALQKAEDGLDKALQGHVGTLTAAQKAAASYAIILKDTADAQGDFQRTSGGLANQQRILSAQIQDTEAEIGTALMPTVLAITKHFNEWLTKANQTGEVQKDVAKAVDIAKKAIEGITPVVKGVYEGFGKLGDVVGGTKNEVELLTAAMIAFKVRGVASLAAGVATSIVKLAGLQTAAELAATRIGIALGIGSYAGVAAAAGGVGIAAGALGLAAYGTARDHKINLGNVGDRTYSAENGKVYVTNNRGATAEIDPSLLPAAIRKKIPISGNDGLRDAAGGSRSASVPFSGVSSAGISDSLKANVSAAVRAVGGVGVQITSGKRAPGPGNDVKNSNHITGNAIDGYVVFPDGRKVPIGTALKGVAGAFGIRSGDVAGFDPKTKGGFDPIHVDDGANVGGVKGGGLTVGKPATVHTVSGVKLLPGGMQVALSKAMGTKSLGDDQSALAHAISYLKGQKQTPEVAHELGSLEKQLLGVHKAVADNLKKAQAALIAKQKPLRDAASGLVSSAFQSYSSKIDQVFDAQTAAGVAAIGTQFFQGGQTPLEKQLADMQAADTLQGLQDALAQASSPEETAAAQRQLDEYNLAADAAKQRALADANYAAAVKRYTDARTLEEEQLDAAMAKFGAQLAAGTANLSDLGNIVGPFGINLDDVGGMADSLAYSFGGLQSAIADLGQVIANITGKPVNLGAGVQNNISTTHGLGGAEGYFLLNPIGMADGGAGRTTGPTLFYSGGDEDFAFSGEGSSFGGGNGGGDLVIKIGEQEFLRVAKRALSRDSKRNSGTGIPA